MNKKLTANEQRYR